MARSSSLRLQDMLFTLYGDYAMYRGGSIWVGSLIKLFAEFGFSEQAVRSALSRMSRKGWLRIERTGNRSYYSLTSRSEKLLAEGTRRIFEGPRDHWDGSWHIVTYSIPEDRRALRDRLRKELGWLGYGQVSMGTWIAPDNRHQEWDELSGRLEVGGFVESFVGRHHGFSDQEGLVRRCWNLEDINAEYAGFIAHYEPTYLLRREGLAGGQPLQPSEAFVQRFMLIHEYRRFPFVDPQLPTPLLPADWLGDRAMKLFKDYHDLLTSAAFAFFDSVFEGPPGQPAQRRRPGPDRTSLGSVRRAPAWRRPTRAPRT